LCESTEKIPRICERYVTFLNSELKSLLIPAKMKYKNISRTTFVTLFLNTFGQEFFSYNYHITMGADIYQPVIWNIELNMEADIYQPLIWNTDLNMGVEGVSE